MKVVAISGTQGAGKSTVLNHLSKAGYVVDDFKVSRAVQQQLGWDSLSRVMDSIDSFITFQEEVLNQKYLNDLKLKKSSVPLTLTERSFGDISAYTMHWCWEHVDKRSWSLDEALRWNSQFYRKCIKYQIEIYDGVVLIPLMKHLPIENDKHRADVSFGDSFYEDLYSFCFTTSIPNLVITQESVQDRLDAIESFLTKEIHV